MTGSTVEAWSSLSSAGLGYLGIDDTTAGYHLATGHRRRSHLSTLLPSINNIPRSSDS